MRELAEARNQYKEKMRNATLLDDIHDTPASRSKSGGGGGGGGGGRKRNEAGDIISDSESEQG